MIKELISYLRQMMHKGWALALPLFLLFMGCERVHDEIHPQISTVVHPSSLKKLVSPFPPLTYHEKVQEWGKEYWIGLAFAKELDLYRSITALKRASYLIPEDLIYRKAEIQYYIMLSYFLGGKYQETIETFDKSELAHVSENFPAYKDLLVMLYDSFKATEQPEKAQFILQLMKDKDEALASKLSIYSAISEGHFQEVIASADTNPLAHDFRKISLDYQNEKKSPGAAQALSAFIPGAGYLYVGQKQSALTSFLINSLFIAAATHFFLDGNLAAGLITTSFEAGWYFGGIYGSGEAAKQYNERIYENKAQYFMNQKKMFPILMIEHAF